MEPDCMQTPVVRLGLRRWQPSLCMVGLTYAYLAMPAKVTGVHHPAANPCISWGWPWLLQAPVLGAVKHCEPDEIYVPTVFALSEISQTCCHRRLEAAGMQALSGINAVTQQISALCIALCRGQEGKSCSVSTAMLS